MRPVRILALPLVASVLFFTARATAFAAGALEGAVEQQGRNYTAIIMFVAFVLLTLGIT